MTVVSVLNTWEELGNVAAWSDLASSCDASPFMWPSFSLPWWYEAGQGRVMGISVDESGILVGLALVYEVPVGWGRRAVRFLGHGSGSYGQLLVADERPDLTAALWERLISPKRHVQLESVPSGLVDGYLRASPVPLAVNRHPGRRCSWSRGDAVREVFSVSGTRVRRATRPEECVALIDAQIRTGGAGVPERTRAFVLAAVDASARAGRLTLHVADLAPGATAMSAVLHGAKTSAVWKEFRRSVGASCDALLADAVIGEALERGTEQIVWPPGFDVCGQGEFPLTDVTA